MTIVSFSEISIFQTSKMRYFYQISLGLKPIQQSKAIQTGVDGHKMLEIFYEQIRDGAEKDEAADSMHNTVEHITGEKLQAWYLANTYAKNLNLDGKPLMVEEPLIIQPRESLDNLYLGMDDLYVGIKPDLVWQDSKGHIFVEDYKFVGRKWSDNKLMHYKQIPIYIALMKEAGWNVEMGYARFFNTTTKEVSHRSYHYSDKQSRVLMSDFIKAAVEVKEFKELPVAEQRELAVRTMNYFACQYCPYAYPCYLTSQGKSDAKTLANLYEENDYGYVFPGDEVE